MKTRSKLQALALLTFLALHMPATASSWWPFASQSTTAKSIQKKDSIYKKQLEAFITYHKLPEDEQTKKIHDYISELRSLAQVLNKKASKDRSPESNEDEDIAQILRCSELVKLLEREASMHPCYRSICCKEIQKAALNIVYRYRLAEPGNHLTCCIIDALGKLALLDETTAVLALPAFQNRNIIWNECGIESKASNVLKQIRDTWAPFLTFTQPMPIINGFGRPIITALAVCTHEAQQLIDAIHPLWFSKKHPARHAFMSAVRRLANNSSLVVDRQGIGRFVPAFGAASTGTTGGASASAAGTVAARRLQRYDAAPAITDNSDGEDEGALNNSHPGSAAGVYDDMPALEFVDSDSEGEGAEERE